MAFIDGNVTIIDPKKVTPIDIHPIWNKHLKIVLEDDAVLL